MIDLKLTTTRLELISATEVMLLASLDDSSKLGELLEARIPEDWPPELLDEGAILYTLEKLAEDPDQQGWWAWLVVLPEGEDRTLIGIVGYKGPPWDGMVEIGYGVLDEFQRKGYATEALKALIDRAFSRDDVKIVIGETLPDLKPSRRVMEKCGFEFTGEGSEEGVIRYALTRETWEGK